MDFFSAPVHYFVTAIHIFSAVFWLGWMVFIFFILRPVAAHLGTVSVSEVMGPVRKRVRRIVFWLIPTIFLTGLYNMSYRGLLDWEMLTATAAGHRMLWKLGAAGVLFAIYYLAPVIMNSGSAEKGGACHGDSHSQKKKKVKVVMHLVAFSAGCVAAYLGISIGG
ncbi:hypothetical protein [Fodinibius halophilus]|uniref:Copper resistance protein D domain-containing protein n=1 Tax=Fodinibius halophilus TaxID=1736908 RepID=A0A6M1T7D3_9BACT|nr:hypothetical protein [Fodinibius halophilus]NGP90117.1 hypothetical protein [Fodinibius halophilus]